jgi:hypothetical protein
MSLVALLAAASLPAQAKSSRPKQHRGKKAMGEVVSFDEATMTLVVDLPGDEDFTGAVDPDVQVKVDHRGWAKSGSHGNPTEGSLEDLVAGTAVLRMKVEDELVTKIRVRRSAEQAPPAEEGEEDEGSTDDAGDGDSTEDSADDSTDDSGDDSTDDSGDDSSDDTTEDPAP